MTAAKASFAVGFVLYCMMALQNKAKSHLFPHVDHRAKCVINRGGRFDA